MVRIDPEGRIVMENSLMYACHHVTSKLPTEVLPTLPDMDPAKLVPIAQRFIDASKSGNDENPQAQQVGDGDA